MEMQTDFNQATIETVGRLADAVKEQQKQIAKLERIVNELVSTLFSLSITTSDRCEFSEELVTELQSIRDAIRS